ncbi:MAG: (S)-ureidoglycine aminohydrolase [Planctomycetota bacterium]
MSLGQTRTHVGRNHAVIAPDSHVVAPLVGWRHTEGVVLMSPAMGPTGCGPGFVQTLVHLTEQSVGGPAPAGCERFVYVIHGRADVAGQTLDPGGYAWLNPGDPAPIRGVGEATLWVHEQTYTPHPDHAVPSTLHGHIDHQTAEPFQGDPAARLAKLLPEQDGFDLEINRFTFDPGAALPLVESHVNEHGLLMTHGQGVYRLGTGADEHWQTVEAGDAIWMGAYCPQWFGCLGKAPATYLYSKNVRRSALPCSTAPDPTAPM